MDGAAEGAWGRWSRGKPETGGGDEAIEQMEADAKSKKLEADENLGVDQETEREESEAMPHKKS